jgi:hypothetical protein
LAFPSFDFPPLTLRLLSVVSRLHARRPLRFGVSGRAIFTLLAGYAAARRGRKSVNRFARKCAKVLFSYDPRSGVPLAGDHPQPSISLDFRRQWHHVKLSA